MCTFVTKDIVYIGASDMRISLFENLFPLRHGVSYNSYVILDEKTAVIDTVDAAVADEFFENLCDSLDGRNLDYVIVNHMEPDHSATITKLLDKYPSCKVIMNARTWLIFANFFGEDKKSHVQIVVDGEELCLGKHTLKFVFAPMVHWPEVMCAYDITDKVLFSADAFGSFGAVCGAVDDSNLKFDEYVKEMRRYYCNIVGKYGGQVVQLLKKVQNLDIRKICPLHGLVLEKYLQESIEKYMLWANYKEENDGVLVVYASMYGNTKKIACAVASEIARQSRAVEIFDCSNTDVSELIAKVFEYKHIVLASVTYNGAIYPKMSTFIEDMKQLGVQNKRFALIENGSWAPMSAKLMKSALESLKNCTIGDTSITIRSATHEKEYAQIENFVKGLLVNKI